MSNWRSYSIGIAKKMADLLENKAKEISTAQIKKNKDIIFAKKKSIEFENSGNIEAMKHWNQKIFYIESAISDASRKMVQKEFKQYVLKNHINELPTYYSVMFIKDNLLNSETDLPYFCGKSPL